MLVLLAERSRSVAEIGDEDYKILRLGGHRLTASAGGDVAHRFQVLAGGGTEERPNKHDEEEHRGKMVSWYRMSLPSYSGNPEISEFIIKGKKNKTRFHPPKIYKCFKYGYKTIRLTHLKTHTHTHKS